MATTSRSPSPALPPPTPNTPGPRATALQKLHADAITHILKTCSYPNFAACFPTPATQVPGSLKLLHEQFTQKLASSLHNEFEAILSERNVIPALNELDRLIEEARGRKGRGEEAFLGHEVGARRLFVSCLAPSLGKWDGEMRGRQAGLERENEELIGKVVGQRRDIEALIEGLEGVVRDLNGSVEVLRTEELEGLREGNREVDGSVV